MSQKKKIHWMALRLNTMGENDSKLGIIANYSKNIRIYQNAFYLIYFFLWGGINQEFGIHRYTPLYIGFPGRSAVKNPPAKQEMWVLSLRQGRSPAEGNGSPLQYSFLENHMERGVCGLSSRGNKRVKHDLATKQQHNYT